MASLCLRKDSRHSFCLSIQTHARHTLEPAKQDCRGGKDFTCTWWLWSTLGAVAGV